MQKEERSWRIWFVSITVIIVIFIILFFIYLSSLPKESSGREYKNTGGEKETNEASNQEYSPSEGEVEISIETEIETEIPIDDEPIEPVCVPDCSEIQNNTDNIPEDLTKTHYIRAGAAEANNGSDWENAWASLPADLVRGHTYYIADGKYNGYVFDDVLSGSEYIIIKKAITNSHGTSTGWQDSYGNEQAVFKGTLTFSTGYYKIDGQVGSGASYWNYYTPYGIKIDLTGAGNGAKAIKSSSNNPVNNLIINKIEATHGHSKETLSKSQDLIYVTGYNNEADNWLISNCWFHDSGRAIFLLDQNIDNWTIENCFFNNNGWASNTGEHSEIASIRNNNKNMKLIFRHNVVKDFISTGGFIFNAGNGIEFYGNIFYWSRDLGATSNHGAIGAWGANENPDVKNFKIYNNLFYNLTASGSSGGAACVFCSATGSSGHEVYNNSWIDSSSNSKEISPFGSGVAFHDYNSFFNSGKDAPYEEAHGQVFSSNPSINLYDFHLA